MPMPRTRASPTVVLPEEGHFHFTIKCLLQSDTCVFLEELGKMHDCRIFLMRLKDEATLEGAVERLGSAIESISADGYELESGIFSPQPNTYIKLSGAGVQHMTIKDKFGNVMRDPGMASVLWSAATPRRLYLKRGRLLGVADVSG